MHDYTATFCRFKYRRKQILLNEFGRKSAQSANFVGDDVRSRQSSAWHEALLLCSSVAQTKSFRSKIFTHNDMALTSKTYSANAGFRAQHHRPTTLPQYQTAPEFSGFSIPANSPAPSATAIAVSGNQPPPPAGSIPQTTASLLRQRPGTLRHEKSDPFRHDSTGNSPSEISIPAVADASGSPVLPLFHGVDAPVRLFGPGAF